MKKVLIFSTFLAIVVANIVSFQTTGFSKQNLKNIFQQNIASAEDYSSCWSCVPVDGVFEWDCPEGSRPYGYQYDTEIICESDPCGLYEQDYSCCWYISGQCDGTSDFSDSCWGPFGANL